MPAYRPPFRALLIAAAVLMAATMLGVAFAPALLTHAPLGLIALSPLYRHMMLVATRVDFMPFLVVTVAARMLGSLLGYAIGAAYGEQTIVWLTRRSPRMGRMLRVLERWFERAAPLLLFAWPGPLFCALAGAAGMGRLLFAILSLLGQALQVAIAYRLALELGPWLEPIVAFFREYTLPTTLLCVLAVLLYYRIRKPRFDDLAEISQQTGEG